MFCDYCGEETQNEVHVYYQGMDLNVCQKCADELN
jgi:ribosome-binding protein aMBF1 (putative translation factor)